MPRTSPEAVDTFVESIEKKGIDLTTYEGLVQLYRIAEQWRDQAMRMWTGKNVPDPHEAYEKCQEFVIDPAVGNVLNEDVTRRLISWVEATFEEIRDRLEDARETVKLLRQVIRRLEHRLSYYRRRLREAKRMYERTRSWYYEVESRYYERIVRELEEQERNLRHVLEDYERQIRQLRELAKLEDTILKIVEEYHGVYDMINGEVLERVSRYGHDIASARFAVINAVSDLVRRGYLTWDEVYTLAWIGYYLGKVEWYYDILRVATLQVRPEEATRLPRLEELETYAQLIETAPTSSTTQLAQTQQASTSRTASSTPHVGIVRKVRLAKSTVLLEEEKIYDVIRQDIRDEKGRLVARRVIVKKFWHRYSIDRWHIFGKLLMEDDSQISDVVLRFLRKKQRKHDLLKKLSELLEEDQDFMLNFMKLVYGSLSIPIEVVYIRLKSGRVDTLIKVGLRNSPQLYIYSKYRRSVIKSETWDTCSEYEAHVSKLPTPSLGITLWFPAGDYIVHDIYREAKLGRVWFTWAIDADGRKSIIDELKRQSILVLRTAGGYFYFLDIVSKSPNKILKIAHRLEKKYGDIGHKRAAYVRQRAGSQAWGVVRVCGKYGTLSDASLEVVYERASEYSCLEEWKERVLRLVTGSYVAKLPEVAIRDTCMRLTEKLTPELATMLKPLYTTIMKRHIGYVTKLVEELDDVDLAEIITKIVSNGKMLNIGNILRNIT